MTTTAEKSFLSEINSDWITAFSKRRNEPEWLQELRLDALHKYLELPFPTPKDPKYKGTDFKAIPFDQFQIKENQEGSLKDANALPPILKQQWDRLEKEGSHSPRLFQDLTKGHLTKGVENLELIPWTQALNNVDAAKKIQSAWEKALQNARNDKFQYLLLALASGGNYLHIPKNTKVNAPIFQYLSADKANAAYFILNFVIVESGAEAQAWEAQAGESTAPQSIIFTGNLINVGANAHAGFYQLQHWGQNKAHFQYQTIDQGASSQFHSVALAFGGRVFHNEETVNLNGSGAQNKVLGVLFGDQSQNFENFIVQNHTAPHTTSDIQFRGALDGKSRSFFSGMVAIEKQAQQSDAYQSSKSLLLSSDAQADSIPNLEILADDVKCSHGAAVGPVDADQKYYLQTRGVPSREAEEIIIQGFFEPVISEVPGESSQDQLRKYIEEKIGRRHE